MLYDSLLVLAVVFVTNAIALGAVVKLSAGQQEVLPAHMAQGLVVFCVIGFFTAFWLKSGQTLGMQAWRIKLQSFDGNKPSLGQALLRCFGATLSAGCLGLGYLWRLVDRNGLYWHDYLSKTELLLLPKKKTGKKQTPTTKQKSSASSGE